MAGRYQSVEIARQEGLVSLLSVPLLHRGQALGALSVYAGVSYRFSDQQTRLLGALAELSALAIEKARLYERVVDLEEQLRQSDQLSALGLLAAEVAHEIRNPLAVMKLLFHSLDLRFPPEDPRSKDAQIITEKMDHLNRIVEQVLDFARISEPCFQAVSVNRLIDDLCLLTRHKLTQQGIQLVRQLAPDLPPLPADPTQIEQAFLNLTLNAVEAMPRGGRLTLRSRAVRWSRRSPAPTHVVVEFADTGPGLSEEQRRRLFSSLLHTTKAKGTGLGLAIVRRVVESHEGRLQLTSRPGRGTSIRLLLPLHRTGGPPSPG
jgi:signal transduction histidine kinase